MPEEGAALDKSLGRGYDVIQAWNASTTGCEALIQRTEHWKTYNQYRLLVAKCFDRQYHRLGVKAVLLETSRLMRSIQRHLTDGCYTALGRARQLYESWVVAVGQWHEAASTGDKTRMASKYAAIQRAWDRFRGSNASTVRACR
jgi:hypothetical protein